MSFEHIKNRRGKSLEATKKALKNKTAFQADERIWTIKPDPGTGVAAALIRFLPPRTENDAPISPTIYFNFFRGPGGVYAETSPSTIGKKCPVREATGRMWNSDDKDLKAKAKTRFANKKYYTNILVLDDKAEPKNNGKVFLFAFGNSIHTKLEEAVVPPYEGVPSVDPFCPWDGANFNIRVKRKGADKDAQTTYEDSSFTTPVAMFAGDPKQDEKIKAVCDQMYDLNEFTNPENFKSYEELKERYETVTGEDLEGNPLTGTTAKTVATNGTTGVAQTGGTETEVDLETNFENAIAASKTLTSKEDLLASIKQ
jgi:hypothetical protein